MKFETDAIHVGEEPEFGEGASGDVVIPIHLSSTFARKNVDSPTGGYEYSRTSNPTRNALEKRLAALEGARYGLAFSSGMAAETVLLISLLKKDSHVVACDDLYGGTRRLLGRVFADNYGIEISHVDATDAGRVEEAIRENTKVVWLETPTNPLLKIYDIGKISEIAHSAKAFVVVDNTFASPFFQRPLGLGADIVVHSTTKYINGHSDSVGGAIMLSDEKIYEKLKFTQNATGAILSPFDSFLTLRGIKTLAVRMQKHQENAQKIAEYLLSHPKVGRVNYPGLPSHLQYKLAKAQMGGAGGMLSFEIKGGAEEAKEFLSKLKVFSLAESLGGVESLAEHPHSMTHSSIPAEQKKQIGIYDSLVRLSIGIENSEDLIEDLERAFRSIT